MTTLYLIRHGIAAERGTYATDDERPLTEEGDRKTKRIAKRLRELGVTLDTILSSPLVRAQQTAEILQNAKLAESVSLSEALAPEGNIHHWLEWLQQWKQTGGKTLALVGHQPDLGNWAETLVWGKSAGRLVVKKAGIIGIELPTGTSPIGNSQLFWLTPPRLLL